MVLARSCHIIVYIKLHPKSKSMVIGLVVTEIQRPELISFTRETARELGWVYIR